MSHTLHTHTSLSFNLGMATYVGRFLQKNVYDTGMLLSLWYLVWSIFMGCNRNFFCSLPTRSFFAADILVLSSLRKKSRTDSRIRLDFSRIFIIFLVVDLLSFCLFSLHFGACFEIYIFSGCQDEPGLAASSDRNDVLYADHKSKHCGISVFLTIGFFRGFAFLINDSVLVCGDCLSIGFPFFFYIIVSVVA